MGAGREVTEIRFKKFKFRFNEEDMRAEPPNLMEQIRDQMFTMEREFVEGTIANLAAATEMTMDMHMYRDASEDESLLAWMHAVTKAENLKRTYNPFEGASVWIHSMAKGLWFELLNPRLGFGRMAHGLDFEVRDNTVRFEYKLEWDAYRIWIECPRNGALYTDSTWTWSKDTWVDVE